MHPAIERALEGAAEPFREIRHAALGVPVHGPDDVARALHIPVEQIAKTLLLRADGLCFAVLSANKRLNFGVVSQLVGTRCRAASRQDLDTATGYPPGSLSPLGTVGIPVFLDSGLELFSTIIVGGGEAGSEIELSVRDFVRLTAALEASLT